MAFFTDIILRAVSRVGFTTKTSNLTCDEVDNNFLAIVDELSIRDVSGSYTAWSAGTVPSGVVRIYNGKLWLSLTSNSAPPSEGIDWARINASVVGHQQNTDTILDANGENEITALAIKKGIRTYKVFTALISQSETNAPTMTILENTLSDTPVFSYMGVGEYALTLLGEYSDNKTAVITKTVVGFLQSETYLAERVSDDVVEVKSYESSVLSNSILDNSYIEIRVYL